MAEDENWAEKRQRIVKCKIHGLHFDPGLTSGCVLCRKEGIVAERPKRPQMVVLLLAVLGLVVLLYRFIETQTMIRIEPEAEAAEVVRGPDTESTRLDPETFRRPLRSVEIAFFETPATDMDSMSAQIVASLRELNRALNAQASARTPDVVAAVDELAEEVQLQPLTVEYLQDLRHGWTRVRDRHFARALWFLRPAAIDPRTDRAAVATYRDVTLDLLDLLDEGWSRAEELLQPVAPNDFDPQDQEHKREEWRSFRADWQARIAELKRQLPDRPGAGADPQFLVAAQRLEQVFSQTSSLAGGELPSAERFGSALDDADAARRSFEDLLAP